MNVSTEGFLTAIQSVKADKASEISHNDRLFLQRIYGEGLNKYVDRLKAIGFMGKDKVLDAGCGYGQWSLALAGLNELVESCDISLQRVQFLQELALRLGIKNISAQVSAIDTLPYPNSYFDAVFCYGVIFLTPWRRSLTELTRVLKPGGKLYLNANGIGWYNFLWETEHNKAHDYDPKAIASRAMMDTLQYERYGNYEPGMNLIIKPTDLLLELKKAGLQSCKLAPEGTLYTNTNAPKPKPFFKCISSNICNIYEVLAKKNR